MPLAQYGQTSPAGLDPWPIESTLAPLATAGSSANAQMMLSDYQYQRDAANNLYGQDMQAQHEFAKSQLAQQLQEANMKALAEAKDPTVLQLMAGNPAYSGVLGDNRANIGDALARAQQGVAAKNFEAGGKGAEGFSNAGYMPPANSIPGLPVNTVQTENVRLAQERLHAAAMLGAAAIHAAGAAGGSGVATGMTGEDPEFGTPVTGHASPKTTPQQIRDWNLKYGNKPIDGLPPNPQLPMTQTDTPANAPAASAPPANRQAGTAAAQQSVLANLNKVPPAVAADIRAKAATNGGQPVVQQDAQGKWHAVGVKGTY